jgi:hypothetical protein
VQNELAGLLLGHPAANRVRSAAGEVDAAGTELDEEERVQPLQRDRLNREEVDREHSLCVRSQKGTPGEPGALAGRAKACLPQNLPHRRGRDSGPEAIQWNAYAFAHVEPLIDKLDGGISSILREIEAVSPETAATPLDAYINSYYRAAKNANAERTLEAHLDACESVSWFLSRCSAA